MIETKMITRYEDKTFAIRSSFVQASEFVSYKLMILSSVIFISGIDWKFARTFMLEEYYEKDQEIFLSPQTERFRSHIHSNVLRKIDIF